jgi:hypothetical protein
MNILAALLLTLAVLVGVGVGAEHLSSSVAAQLSAPLEETR